MAEEQLDSSEAVELVALVDNDGGSTGSTQQQQTPAIEKAPPKGVVQQLIGLVSLALLFLGGYFLVFSMDTIAVTKQSHRGSVALHLNTTTVFVTPTAARQIESFRNGTGLLVNFHITHHGGTTICREFGYQLKKPSFSCLGPTAEDGVDDQYPRRSPWGYNETEENLNHVRQYFRFVSWEFSHPPKAYEHPQIWETNWEHPNMVSVLVVREPISRSLAGDGGMLKKFPWWPPTPDKNTTFEEWWQFAHEKTHNNNFALRILSDAGCCNGSHTNPGYLEKAKELVQRFTFVIDIACLDEGMDRVSEILGFELMHHVQSTRKKHTHHPLSERIPYPEVLQYLEEKNKLDIELYEWSKSLALVNCEALED